MKHRCGPSLSGRIFGCIFQPCLLPVLAIRNCPLPVLRRPNFSSLVLVPSPLLQLLLLRIFPVLLKSPIRQLSLQCRLGLGGLAHYFPLFSTISHQENARVVLPKNPIYGGYLPQDYKIMRCTAYCKSLFGDKFMLAFFSLFREKICLPRPELS